MAKDGTRDDRGAGRKSGAKEIPAVKHPAVSVSGARPQPISAGIGDKEIGELESETISKVDKTITALESAIAVWEAAKKKPEALRPKFVRYKLVHEVLSRWQTKALKSRVRGSDIGERVGLLREFVDICRTYIQGGAGV